MTLRHLIALLATGLVLTACGQQESAAPEKAMDDGASAMTSTESMESGDSGEMMETDDSGEMMETDDMSSDEGNVSPAVADAVASEERPEEDTARDADRKPGEVLTFFGVEPGMTVLEFVAAGGYYTELLSRVVGPEGHVYATRLEEARIADDRLPNVTALGDQDWGLDPGSVDLVFTALNYHDLFNIEGLDRPALVQRFYDVLEPGGTFAVIDHAAEEGSGDRDTDTLHRVDEQTVVDEITGVGFELADSSDVLRHPEDDRTQNVFAEGLRGKTDRYVLKFVKPEM